MTSEGTTKSAQSGAFRAYAEVALDVPLRSTFTYGVPEAFPPLEVGQQVHVPWRNRSRSGVVLALSEQCPQGYRVRAVASLLDPRPVLDGEQIALLRFIAAYYRAPIGEVVRMALPVGLQRQGERRFRLLASGSQCLEEGAAGPALSRVLSALRDAPEQMMLGSDLIRSRGVTYGLLDAAMDQGYVEGTLQLDAAKVNVAFETWVHPAETGDPAHRLGAKQAALLAQVEKGAQPLTALRGLLGDIRAPLRRLVELGRVRLEEVEVVRDPFRAKVLPAAQRFTLTAEQQVALGEIAGALGGFHAFLLHGVTGSGKTEVYIRVIRQVRDAGQGALVILPEIALTPQLAGLFRAHFGDDIAVLHSALSVGERYDAWRRLRTGRVGIAVGARSALFAPVQRLGVVVVDEEHDASFKQGEGARYHARDMALMRAKIACCPIILGSATPSLESWALTKRGRMRLLQLQARVSDRPLPSVQVVDMSRSEDSPADAPEADAVAAEGVVERVISPLLQERLVACLERKEQAIVLLNRRGHSTFVQCHYCGEALYCPNCSVSLTYHKRQNALRCHYCDHQQPLLATCPRCGRGDLGLLGMGTERLVQTIEGLIPAARVERLDRDSVGGQRLHGLLERFHAGAIDILVGTQMVAKGHDIHNVTLVGVVLADFSLHFPDFRAAERTFQLLTQVAGRAGRGDRLGEVIIQTLLPDHPVLMAAREQSYSAFVAHEMPLRQALHYPPFAHLVALRVEGPDSGVTEAFMGEVAVVAQRFRPKSGQVLGPAPAPLAKIRGRVRWQLLLKGSERTALHQWLDRILTALNPEGKPHPQLRFIVDVDPLDML